MYKYVQPKLIIKSFVKLNVRKSMVPEYKENIDLLRLVKIREWLVLIWKRISSGEFDYLFTKFTVFENLDFFTHLSLRLSASRVQFVLYTRGFDCDYLLYTEFTMVVLGLYLTHFFKSLLEECTLKVRC